VAGEGRERGGFPPDRQTVPGRQRPEVGEREWLGTAMPRGRLERGEGGANRRARTHSVERLRRLTGGPGHTVPSSCAG
jgi:hypothetical protein